MQSLNPIDAGVTESSRDNRSFVHLMNRCFPAIMWYILGVVTPFLVLAVLVACGVKPPKSKAEILIDKWQLKDGNDALLLVSVPSDPNIYFTLGIERDPKTGLLREIGITRGKNLMPDIGVFMYTARGKYGTPTSYYGSPEQGIVWRDLNADGIFDQCIDYRNKTMTININGIWVPGIGTTDVGTEKGLFRFDPNAGEWKSVAATPLLENQ